MAIKVSTTVLRTVPLFAGFSDEQLAMLVQAVTRRSVPRGAMLMGEGDATDSLYIVISGRLKVMMGDADGKEVILALLGPGEIVGKRLPKQDIAKMIGASREMVSRVMKDLQIGGYIEPRGSTILLRDKILLPE